MIPFLAGAALKLSPVGALLKRIPRGVWIALAVALLIGLGALLHGRAVKSAHDTAYAEGKADEAKRIEKKAIELAAKAAAISETLRSMNNVENRRIAGAADAIRLQGPGKAACLNPAPASPGRRQPATGETSAAVDQVPGGERVDLIALPFAGAIALAEEHDLCIAEASTWREDKRLQIEAWQKAQ